MNFKNKNILITGAFGFLGKALTKKYLNAGANLYLTDLRTKKIKNKFKNQKIYSLNCNLESSSQILSLIKDVKNKFKKIDIIINNAAVAGNSIKNGWNTNLAGQSREGWEKSSKLNLIATFQIIQKLVPILKSKDPNIINISSIYGTAVPNFKIYTNTKIFNPIAYSTSKAGIIYMTKWLAKILGKNKIRVNAISPGGIQRNQEKKFVKNYIDNCPIKRMTKETDVVNACFFLTSDMASYITGQNLVVDGGYTI